MDNNLEEKLGAILSDPAMMEKIQAMARSLGQNTQEASVPEPSPAPSQAPRESAPARMPEFDPAMLRGLTALAGQNRADPNEQALLKALTPYLSRDRISKLENAMRAARMAKLASAFLGSGGLQFLSGR